MSNFFSGKIGFQTFNSTIASGQQTSDSIVLNGFGMVGIILPAALTSSAMTFTGSQDDVTYTALYNTSGTILSAVVAASRIVLFTPGDFVGVNYLKLVAGSAEGGTRTIQVISRSFL
jgi:hypothetical protein